MKANFVALQKKAIAFLLDPRLWGATKNKTKQQVPVRLWKDGEPLYTVGGNVKWCSCYGKQKEVI